MCGSFASCSRSAARFFLGLTLVVASLSKIASVTLFAAAVAKLGMLPASAGLPVGIAVIAAELATGMLLLIGTHVKESARVAAILFALFAAVLTVASMRGIELSCNCFGNLGPKLPLRHEAVLDLILGAIASSIVCRSNDRSPAGGRSAVILVIFSIWAATLIVWPMGSPLPPALQPAGPPAADPLRRANAVDSGRTNVILIADFDDFGCQLCLDDFLAFCDSLTSGLDSSRTAVRLFARRDTARNISAQARMLDGWARGNGYVLPVQVDRDSLFEHSGAGKTSVFIFDPAGHVLEIASFPLGPNKRSELLAAIRL